MSIRSFFKSLISMPIHWPPARRVRRLSVESLEIRSVLTGYDVTGLGSLVEGGGSQAADINAVGQVVGRAYAGMGTEHAFLWQNGVMTDLGTLGGAASQAFGINDAGKVVGVSSLASDWTAYRAFMVTPEDTDGNGTPDRWFRDSNADGANDLMQNLGTLGGGSPVSYALDVNNLGQVVGMSQSWSSQSWSSQSTVTRAFLWQNGMMSDQGTLGGNYRVARAINDAGQITGVYSEPNGNAHTVLRANGVTTDLGPSYGSGATDINAKGQLVDSYSGLPRLWTPTVPNSSTGTFTGLGLLPLIWLEEGGAYADPAGMNDTGHVVGTQTDFYGNEASSGEAYRGVLWADGVVEPLPLEFALAINDLGQIVGNSGGSAYLLTPHSLGIPTVSIGDVTIDEGNTGTRSATFTVNLSAPSGQAITLGYATSNGTAAAGSDYYAASGTLIFAAGESTKTFTVKVIGDMTFELNETFNVNLNGATGATIADGQAVCTIVNDDEALPRLSITDVSKNEGNSGTTAFNFFVTLSAPSKTTVTVKYATANGTATVSGRDYDSKSGTLTFQPGQTSKTVAIQVRGDRTREAHETFFLNLSSSQEATIADAQGSGTIQNDDGSVLVALMEDSAEPRTNRKRR